MSLIGRRANELYEWSWWELGQSAGNRGFREIEPVCKPGPDFDSCSRDQLIGTGGVVFAVALFVGLSGFVVWFVVTDQWFALGDKIRSLCSQKRR